MIVQVGLATTIACRLEILLVWSSHTALMSLLSGVLYDLRLHELKHDITQNDGYWRWMLVCKRAVKTFYKVAITIQYDPCQGFPRQSSIVPLIMKTGGHSLAVNRRICYIGKLGHSKFAKQRPRNVPTLPANLGDGLLERWLSHK